MEAEARAAQVDEYFSAAAPRMRRTAYLIVHDWQTAEDMVQPAFVKLYLAWPRVRQDSVDACARRTLVNVCLSHLRKHRRVVLALRFLDDLSIAEVADVLGMAPGTVKSQTSRALVTLRGRLPLLSLDEEVSR